MSQEIIDLVVRKLDAEKIAAEFAEKLLGDDKFYQAVSKRLSDEFMSYAHRQTQLEQLIVDRLATKLIAEHGQSILSKIDISAILNALTFRTASKLQEKLRE